MHLERLRLAGFKSFVEPTELAIEPGLTGIVGPNGCGKSNLVEALRWVMGEASARRLRGGEMDDLIFGGSDGRPARNVAEVALTIDNAAANAPHGFNDGSTIEVVRRIARGAGSSYRVNGREARARDVQLLFADAASGPHSGALVGQGRISSLIAAKPGERRALLDEAAGTAGLHARRHEAELKLRAAEDNLARLDDVIATLATQADTLRKQARQAQRYRRLGEQIRDAEARLLHARWTSAAADLETLAAELRAAERVLAAATEAALAGERMRGEAETALPPLRLAQAASAAALQRLVHAREALEGELRRVVAARADAEQRLTQFVQDRDREAERLADADAALALHAEERRSLEPGTGADKERETAAGRLAAAVADLATAEAGLHQMTEARATAEARRGALDRQRRDLAERQNRLAARLGDAERQREQLAAAGVATSEITATAAALEAATKEVGDARDAAEAVAAQLATCRQREGEANDRVRECERGLESLKAEADALTRVLAPAAAVPEAAPLLSRLGVTPGFEAATAALFDGELSAPELAPNAESAPGAGWRGLPPLAAAPLPAEVHPLAGEIAAPDALGRRLAHAGWVESAAEGWRLQPLLAAGQSLVDRDGRLWRWDGYTRTASGSAATAEQLRQRNRLAQLQPGIADAGAALRAAQADAAARRDEREQAGAAERQSVAALRAADEQLARLRETEVRLARQALAAEARLTAAAEAVERLTTDLGELDRQVAETRRGLSLLPDPGLAQSGLDASRAQADAARRRESAARGELDRLAREAESRRRRLAALEDEEASWQRRREAAAVQQQALTERHAGVAAQLAELTARPAAIAAESERLARAAAEAAATRRHEEDALAIAEARLREATAAARQADAAVGEAREERARLGASHAAAAATTDRLRAEIAERLDTGPEDLAAAVAAQGGPAPAVADLAARLERLLRERDTMGPVNLLAEQEAAEVEARLAGLSHERADLTTAIARLRRGIAALDQEGRKRLVAAFDQLNEHFGGLFARLFGGGTAALAWSGDDDPLDAGLDILARPPGKRLDTLSLLSGGEQALTAIALIFAMFLTHPAPVCVLDEVDAPLDDANVDGFCRLVADIADTTATRFLLITHHRVTMARMDRLFGVTMAERGVSQLVSVDLARAATLRQTA